MANELPPIFRQYDRLAAVVVLAILLVSLLYLVLAGLRQQEEVRSYDGALELRQPSKSQLVAADLSADEMLLASVERPAKSSLLIVRTDVDAPNLCSPARRLLCVRCAKPIAWMAEVCPYCKAEQPKEPKIDLSTVDSDGDGIPDQWELKYGLNPQDPADADADLDGDGFTNMEEYQAKTDPADPKNHPGYETRMSLKGIEGTKLPLRVINKMELPSSRDGDGNAIRHYQLTFVSVAPDGTPGTTALRAKDGEPVGKSGFRVIRYNELPTRQITVGTHKQPRFINVSTVDLVREADGKTATLIFWDQNNPEWPGEPLLEQKADITIDIPGAEAVVAAPGVSFQVKGETFTVRAVDADKKTAILEKNADKTVFELK